MENLALLGIGILIMTSLIELFTISVLTLLLAYVFWGFAKKEGIITSFHPVKKLKNAINSISLDNDAKKVENNQKAYEDELSDEDWKKEHPGFDEMP